MEIHALIYEAERLEKNWIGAFEPLWILIAGVFTPLNEPPITQ